ncbi:MAG: Crp/Fnr family transcriptional regulator [Thermoproteota archaeon]
MKDAREQEATGSPVFNIPVQSLKPFLNRGRRREYMAGTIIYNAGEVPDELYYLWQGLIKQFIITADGVEKTIGLGQPGCVFGEALLLNQCPSQCTAIAVRNSVVYAFPRPIIEELFQEHPEVLIDIAKSLSYKIRALTSQIWVMASDNSVSKVGKVLYLLTQDVKEKNPVIHLTHQALADMAGIHRVTTSTVLAKLSKEGILECKRGCLVIKRREHLLKYRSL